MKIIWRLVWEYVFFFALGVAVGVYLNQQSVGCYSLTYHVGEFDAWQAASGVRDEAG